VRTSWQSLLKVVEGNHTINNRVTGYKTTLLCRGEFYWFFERQDAEWAFCPLYSIMHENGVEHLKRIVTLEEMAL
jgi:Zn-finger protein